MTLRARLIGILVIGCALTADRPAAAAEIEACAATRPVLQDHLLKDAEPTLLVNRDAPVDLALEQHVIDEKGWRGEAPSRALIRRWRQTQRANAMICPSLVSQAAGVGTVVSSAEALSPEVRGRLIPRVLVDTVTLAVLDAEGRTGLVYQYRDSNQLAGFGRLHLVRKVDGAWKAVGMRLVWIS